MKHTLNLKISNQRLTKTFKLSLNVNNIFDVA